ncbi:MAG: DUF2155 domain-containing protein [Bdellovibrionales bacterium]
MSLFRFFSFLTVLIVGLGMTGPALAVAPSIEKPIAVLRALDKATARVAEIEVHTGKPYNFGTIFITVDSCRVTTPEEQPEAAAFLEVSEFKSGEQESLIFKGWMFASSPSLSAMEHPIYDLWVMGCKDEPSATPATSK